MIKLLKHSEFCDDTSPTSFYDQDSTVFSSAFTLSNWKAHKHLRFSYQFIILEILKC